MGEDWDREINLVQSTIKRLPLVEKKKRNVRTPSCQYLR